MGLYIKICFILLHYPFKFIPQSSCLDLNPGAREIPTHIQGLQTTWDGRKKTQPPTPHVNILDCAEVVLAKEFAAARTTNGKVFSWPTKPTDGSRGGLGCDGDPSTPGQVDIPGRLLFFLHRRYSTTPCCPPARRRNPHPNPRFGV